MSHIVFVADLFADEYIGGAELTTEALIEACSFEYIKLKAKDVTIETLQKYSKSFWVFGNFTQMDPNLVPTIVANIRYAVLEYDYKFCQYRSTHKHVTATGNDCDCHEGNLGKLISAFYFGADDMFWMSEGQRQVYSERFPFLENKGIILSSVFSKDTLKQIKFLQNNKKKSGWLVQKSDSWIKGTEDAQAWCENQNLDFECFSGLTHSQLLMKFYRADGFVFYPKGHDTCPRVVIEAKLLGCKLELNDNVQHAKEPWFDTTDLESIVGYLESRTSVFWSRITRAMDITSTISAYTTTYNCKSQGYPYEESIKSLINNFDEIVVVDAGSTDGTFERLLELVDDYPNKLLVHRHNIDFDHPRWAIHSDGDLKAKARSMCTKDWCWQMDVDEIIHEGEREKIQDFLKLIPKAYDIAALPVVEYWGSAGKVRVDVNPWKWRLSRNKSHITHGIPKELRMIDEDGHIYANKGTDSCDYIDITDYNILPHATFYDKAVHAARISALSGNEEARKQYELWFNQISKILPTIYHYSWYNIERKISSYKSHWGKFWKSMYNLDTEDTAENNVCFDKPWSSVTEEDIKKLAQNLEEKTGGHIFHTKINWDNSTPSVSLEISGPINDC